jgi:hypothetical protein
MQDPSAPGRRGIPLYNATLLDTHERIPGVSGDLLNFNVSASASSGQASYGQASSGQASSASYGHASSGQASSAQAAPKQSRGTARQIRPGEIAERSQPGLRKGKAVQLREGSRAPISTPNSLGYYPDSSHKFRNQSIGRVRQMTVKGLNRKIIPGAIAVDVPGTTRFILARPEELIELENHMAFPTNSLRFRVGDIVRVIDDTYSYGRETGMLARITEVRENGDLIVHTIPESQYTPDRILHQSDVEFVSNDRNQGGRRKTNRKKKNKNKSRRTRSY